MKLKNKPELAVLLAAAGGFIGYLLRRWQMGTLDEAGLLAKGHPSGILLAVLTVVVAAGVVFLTQGTRGRTFQVTSLNKILEATLCVYLVIRSVQEGIAGPDLFGILCIVLALAAAVAMAGMLFGKKGNHSFLCLYAVVLLVSRFRVWCMNPQIAEYCYQLLFGVVLMLATYHRAAFDMDMGRALSWKRWSLLGVYLAMVSMTDSDPVFYLVMALWLVSDQYSPAQKPETAAQEEP